MTTQELLAELSRIGGDFTETSEDRWCDNELMLSVYVSPRENIHGYKTPKAVFGQTSCSTDVKYARALYRAAVLVDMFNTSNGHMV